MDTRQIHDTLNRMYKEEGARIVFWNDPDKEFQTILPALNLDGVSIRCVAARVSFGDGLFRAP